MNMNLTHKAHTEEELRLMKDSGTVDFSFPAFTHK